MRFNKVVAYFTLAAGMTLSGSSALMAQDGRYGDIRHDTRDLRYDHERAERLRRDIARDQWKLDTDARAGRRWAVSNDARDLARDQRSLDALTRDIRHDRADLYRDRHDRY